MGFDINELFGKAQSAAEQGMNDLLKTGGNAALGYLEGQAINILKSDKAHHEEASQQAVTEIMNRPNSPMGDYFSNLMRNPVLNNYGPYIVFGLAGVLLIGMYIRKG